MPVKYRVHKCMNFGSLYKKKSKLKNTFVKFFTCVFIYVYVYIYIQLYGCQQWHLHWLGTNYTITFCMSGIMHGQLGPWIIHLLLVNIIWTTNFTWFYVGLFHSFSLKRYWNFCGGLDRSETWSMLNMSYSVYLVIQENYKNYYHCTSIFLLVL